MKKLFISQGISPNTPASEVGAAMVNPEENYLLPNPPPPEIAGWKEQVAKLGIDEELSEDLSDLNSEEFVTDGEDENDIDDPDFYTLLDDNGDISGQPSANSCSNDEDKDNRDLRVLSKALNQLHRAAKLQVNGLARIQAVVKRSPNLSTLAEILKPFTNVMVPETTQESIKPFIPFVQQKSKFPQMLGVKVHPKKMTGTSKFCCPLCNVEEGWWAKIDAHIREFHTNQLYGPCVCGFTTYNSDSLKRHKREVCRENV